MRMAKQKYLSRLVKEEVERDGRFHKFVNSNMNKQPRTVLRYIYILKQFPDELLVNLKNSESKAEIQRYVQAILLHCQTKSMEFDYMKNFNMVYFAIKSYLRSELNLDAHTHFSELAKPFLTKRTDIKQRALKTKHVPEKIYQLLVNATNYKLVYKKDAPEDVAAKAEFQHKRQVIIAESSTGRRLFMKNLIDVLFISGLRISEALQVRFKNLIADVIEDDDKKIKYYYIKLEGIGKGGKSSRRLLTKELYLALKDYQKLLNADKDDLMFDIEVTDDNKTLKDIGSYTLGRRKAAGSSVYLLERKIVKIEYEFKRLGKIIAHYDDKNTLTPHMFRHGLGMKLFKEGMQLEQIQQILDHSNIETTQIYAHSTNAEIVNRYSNIMEKK